MKKVIAVSLAAFVLSIFGTTNDADARRKKFKGATVIADAHFCRIVNGKVVQKRTLPYIVMFGRSPWCNATARHCHKAGMDFLGKSRTKMGGKRTRKLAIQSLSKRGASCTKGFARGTPASLAAKCAANISKKLVIHQFKSKTCVRGYHAFCAARHAGWVPCDARVNGHVSTSRTNAKRCQWFGRAPLCKGHAGICHKKGMVAIRYSKRGDGKRCFRGRKVLCCPKGGRVPPVRRWRKKW